MHDLTESPRFQEQCQDLRKAYPRLDSALDGIRWALRRNPEIPDVLFPGFGGRGIKLDPWPGVPQAIVYYLIRDGGEVLLYAIYDTASSSTDVVM